MSPPPKLNAWACDGGMDGEMEEEVRNPVRIEREEEGGGGREACEPFPGCLPPCLARLAGQAGWIIATR